MNKVLILLVLFFFCMSPMCSASVLCANDNKKERAIDSAKQKKKQYKELQQKVKTAQGLAVGRKPNYASAWTTIKPLLSDTLVNKEANTWFVAGLIQNKLELVQAEKIFLKQAYDTVAYYRSIYDMAGYFHTADSLAHMYESHSQLYKYRRAIRKMLSPDMVNLYYGGLYYALKEKYQEAHPFFTRYIESFQWPIFSQSKLGSKVPLARVAYYQVLCGYVLKKPNVITKYAPMVLADTALTRNVLPIISDTYHAQNDTTLWLSSLKRGLRDYRDEPFYYASLIEYYCDVKQFDKAMALVDTQMSMDTEQSSHKQAQHLYLRGLIFHKRNKLDQAIVYYKRAIQCDSAYAMAYANLGVIYSLKTVGLESQLEILSMNNPEYNQTIDKIHDLYCKAQPYYEKARELRPKSPQLWAQGLYRVYYKLNMGDKFKEVEPYIEQLRNK